MQYGIGAPPYGIGNLVDLQLKPPRKLTRKLPGLVWQDRPKSEHQFEPAVAIPARIRFPDGPYAPQACTFGSTKIIFSIGGSIFCGKRFAYFIDSSPRKPGEKFSKKSLKCDLDEVENAEVQEQIRQEKKTSSNSFTDKIKRCIVFFLKIPQCLNLKFTS